VALSKKGASSPTWMVLFFSKRWKSIKRSAGEPQMCIGSGL
jgi:hypothetical protein